MKVYILRDDVCMKFSCCRMPYCVLVTGFVLGLLVIALRHVILYGSAIVGHVFACINSAVLSICAICWPKEERIFAPATYSLLGRRKASV